MVFCLDWFSLCHIEREGKEKRKRREQATEGGAHAAW